MPKRTGKEFQWTDDEAELLLSVAYEYKVKQSAECVDWESVKSKYDDILELFREALPSTSDEAGVKDYPHDRGAITKIILSTKLKNIRIKFRQAVDSGRRSGHGRVVMIYFEMCQKIWGGSPATEQLDGGIESVDLTVTSEGQTVAESPIGSPAPQPDDESTSASAQPLPPEEPSVLTRRKLIDATLKNHKQNKLKRKVPVDIQLLSCAQEELGIKRRLVERMEHMDKQYNNNMTRLSTNMEKLTNSISEGFSMLHALIGQQPRYPYLPPPPQPQPGYPFHPSMLHAASPSASYGSPSISNSSSHDPVYPDPEDP